MDTPLNDKSSRRDFIKLGGLGLGTGFIALNQASCSGAKNLQPPAIQGFDETSDDSHAYEGWVPVSERKIRVGLVGYGLCKFAAGFGFQDHPNVEVVAVSDLFPDRCAELATVTGCKKTYPSLEELVKDDNIEAVFVATDAPSHARHCIEVLKHGKHVATAVPAVFGSLEEADMLFEAVNQSGLKYMMFETSMFRENLYAMRQIYNAGGFGKIIYAEGEYWHYSANGLPSYKNWRHGMPPDWYPTHSNAYYIGVTDETFTHVSSIGMLSAMERYQKENNQYRNPFGSTVALYRTSEGSMARMARSSESPGGYGYGTETGRLRGTRGCYYGEYKGKETSLPNLKRPPLPPGVPLGHHGGSHGYLMNDFVMSILQDRKPLVDIAMALNMTVPGVVAHQSALRDGELMKITQYKFTT